MNHVSKQQAAAKQVAPETQAFQATELVKKTEELDNSVNETHDVGDGLEQITEEERRQKKQKTAERKTDNKEKSKQESQMELFRDPDLGHYIDIVR